MKSTYNFQQLEAPESVELRVYTQLRQAIMQGQLQPGERLVLDRLATSLGVSRVPVTQALKRLETQGFVSTTRRGETVVVELSASDAFELYILRIRLQPLAARYAALRLQPDQLAEIERLAEYLAPLSGAERFAMDRQLHEAIANASGMPRLAQMCNNLWELTEVYRAALDTKVQDLNLKIMDNENSSREHAAMLVALRQRDGEAAEAIERAHVVRATKLVFKVIGQSIPITESEINDLR
jgi:DNA-binding GntR family transcriptional regulator